MIINTTTRTVASGGADFGGTFSASVLTKAQVRHDFTTDRVAGEFTITLGTEIKTNLLVDVVADTIAAFQIAALKYLVYLKQVISIILRIINSFHRRASFDLHYVAQIFFVVQDPFATIAREVNHVIHPIIGMPGGTPSLFFRFVFPVHLILMTIIDSRQAVVKNFFPPVGQHRLPPNRYADT